jgi:hypothetical protein
MCRSVFSVDNIQVDPFRAFGVNCNIIANIIHDKKTLKKHNKFMSTFPTNLEKKYVKNLYFHPFSPSLLVGSFVIWGF